MSADNWLQCPVCKGLPENLRGGYKHLYGKIPEDEYLKAKQQYDTPTQSVRVDYEYDIHEHGVISLDFYAECTMCHAKWEHSGVLK